MNWFQIDVRSGSPIPYGPYQLTLRTLLLKVHIPWINGSGGLLYNRPVAVLVQRSGEPDRTLPIVNVNRLARGGMFVLALLAIAIARRVMHD